MRVTTLLNKLLQLPGLWVQAVRFEDDTLIIEVRRRFRLLSCPECGTQVRGRFQDCARNCAQRAPTPTNIRGLEPRGIMYLTHG